MNNIMTEYYKKQVDELKIENESLRQRLLDKDWLDFPESAPVEGELVVMAFDGEGMFTHFYKQGLEENFRPFKRMQFIRLPLP
jgi:hypothetical protein